MTTVYSVVLLCLLILVSGQKYKVELCKPAQNTPKGENPKPNKYQFFPRSKVQSFSQWQGNQGYCGEVTVIQAGLMFGQWTSQYNIRSLSSPFQPARAQTGDWDSPICDQANGYEAPPPPFLDPSGGGLCYNAQLEFDDVAPLGSKTAASIGNVARWFGLNASTFRSDLQTTDDYGSKAGYQEFMVWMKQSVASGASVSFGVMNPGGTGVYQHIVSVAQISSNHLDASAYHDDDILYLEDHGAQQGPAQNVLCGPYIYGYTFKKFGTSGHHLKQSYWEPFPTNFYEPAGEVEKWHGPNYGYAFHGVLDERGETFPVTLTILWNSNNVSAPGIGYAYEYPTVLNYGNAAPAAQLMVFGITVGGLSAGSAYNLYLYSTSATPLTRANLTIPTRDFNANAHLASRVYPFTATCTEYRMNYTSTSDVTLVFRAVKKA